MKHSDMQRIERSLGAMQLDASRDLDRRVSESLKRARQGLLTKGDDAMADATADAPSFSELIVAWPLRTWLMGGLGTIAAAVLILAAMTFWPAGPSSALGVYAALAQAVEASKAGEWVHERCNVRGFEFERWTSFKPFRRFTSRRDGISCFDAAEGRQYIYEFATNTMTISESDGKDVQFDYSASSFLDAYAGIMKKAEASGFGVERRRETIDSVEYDAFLIPQEGSDKFMRVLVDPSSGRIARIAWYTDKEQAPSEWDITAAVDYPQEGPADIYELGVPKDAKVVRQSVAEVKALDEKIEKAIDAFPQTYLGVVCHCTETPEGQSIATHVSVIRKKDGRFRVDEHYGFVPTGPVDMDALKKPPLPDDMAWCENWAKTAPVQSVFITDATDRQKVKWIHRDLDGKVGVQYVNSDLLRYTAETLTWQRLEWRDRIGLHTRTLPGRKGEWGPLVGAELTMQPLGVNGRVYYHPVQADMYFNPDHDFALEIQESITDPAAPWIADKKWLDAVSPDDKSRDRYVKIVRTVLEYAQTPSGQWYAHKVREESEVQGSQKHTELMTIHVDTAREIPDEVFTEPNPVKAEAAD